MSSTPVYQRTRQSMRPLLLILTVVAIAATTLGVLRHARELPQTATGNAAIGGAFTLTDADGKTVRDSDFRGKAMLVFFGFTRCPDICPLGLGTMTEALKLLGKQAEDVTPVFITVDPESDTPAALKAYMTSFDSRFVALTGTKEATQQAIDAYKVYASKKETAGAPYMMDHSGYLYLMDREGRYVTHFDNKTAAPKVADTLRAHLDSEK